MIIFHLFTLWHLPLSCLLPSHICWAFLHCICTLYEFILWQLPLSCLLPSHTLVGIFFAMIFLSLAFASLLDQPHLLGFSPLCVSPLIYSLALASLLDQPHLLGFFPLCVSQYFTSASQLSFYISDFEN